MNQSEHILADQLAELAGKTIPFHMPGHKRVMAPAPDLFCGIDLTEITGADNLHHAEGILREAMDRTAQVFHADRTFYLVNGSTVGNLAAIRAAVSPGQEAIAAGSCHRSVLNGLELAGAKPHLLIPERVPGWDFPASVQPAQVKKLLEQFPETAALVLTTPAYEGVISDAASIAELCHDAGVLLIADEAHGAHLGLFEDSGFPAGAIAGGADLVIQSAHKTLPSLTQTALLHVRGSRVPIARVEQALAVYETSSPSYLLMSSLDGCTGILRERGRELMTAWKQRLDSFYEAAGRLQCLEVFHPDTQTMKQAGIYQMDPSKILLRARKNSIMGQMLFWALREEYGIEAEMARGCYVLAMTSLCDTDKMMRQLTDALIDLDQRICAGEQLEHYAQRPASDVVCRNFQNH
ncbi:MAG: aminotransferase class I/II-fold pyridoxal phosphate-dependent enzyme [Lachnospiraceae bacterium]|nr:aminotransferase class I/II-fold pyridoxal phosphate-dependent enzyme [Lachnospiraceae bacterium]